MLPSLSGLITLFKLGLTIQFLPMEIHVHNDLDDFRSQSTVLITEPGQETERRQETPRTYALPTPLQSDTTVRPKGPELPFGFGIHMVVNQKSWWFSNQWLSLSSIRLIPAIEEQELIVPRSDNSRFFKVKFINDGKLEVSIWDDSEYREAASARKRYKSLPPSTNNKWCFTRYKPNDSILFDEYPPIAVKLDEGVVKAAWVVKYLRKGFQEETFLFVLKNDTFSI